MFIFVSMRELALNTSHDIEVDGDHLARFTTSGTGTLAKRVAQAALCMLKTEQGEAFTDGNHGAPWFAEILGLAPVHLDIATRLLRQKLAAVPGVDRVDSIKIECDGRNLTGHFRLICTDGDTAEENF